MGDIMFGKIGTIGEPKRLLNFDNITLKRQCHSNPAKMRSRLYLLATVFAAN